MAKTHFTRLLDRKQVNECMDLLNEAVGRKVHGHVKAKDETFKVKAPDGDEIFTGLKGPGGLYICRLHKEVFTEVST